MNSESYWMKGLTVQKILNVELDIKPPYAIFQIQGKLGFAELSDIRSKLNPILKEAKYKIIFDLKNLDSIDSSGVALLFHVAQETTSYQGGAFALSAPGDFVKDVMVLSGIYNKFIVHNSVDEAILA